MGCGAMRLGRQEDLTMGNKVITTPMTKEEWAANLNGCEYREEISHVEAETLKAAGLVVVFGASDDIMCFQGAIHDELSAYGGVTAYVDKNGLIDRSAIDDDDDEGVADHVIRKRTAKTIRAIWCDSENSPCWTYQTEIPHASFDVVERDEDQIYCRGIIFDLNDLGSYVMSSTKHPPVQAEPTTLAYLAGMIDMNQSRNRVGKKRAGRLLDGVQHDGYPVVGGGL